MKIAVHQPQYMPWSGYFHKMASVDMFVLLDNVQFKKNEWQHRNRIRTPQGTQWLSVPNHYRFPQRINEVTLNNAATWPVKHFRSLEMNYAKSGFFPKYRDKFEQFFGTPRETMDQVTVESVELLRTLLGITTPCKRSSHHACEGESTQRLVSICRFFGADTYLAGAGGHDYMELELFHEAGITVEFQEYKSPVYHQVWARTADEFIPDLSVIDLLFNCGDSSLAVLMGASAS